MEEGRVSIGIFHTCYFSLDVRRTECAGQTICSVMVPASRKIEKQLPAKHLEHQTTLPPVKKHVLGVDVLSVFRLLKVRAKNGVSIGAYQTS